MKVSWTRWNIVIPTFHMVPSNETNISHSQPAFLEMILLFPRWDLLVSWRVIIIPFKRYCLKDSYYPLNKKTASFCCQPFDHLCFASARRFCFDNGQELISLAIHVCICLRKCFIWIHMKVSSFILWVSRQRVFFPCKITCTGNTHHFFWKKQTAGEAFCWRSLEVAQVDWTFLFNIFLLNAGPTPDSESGVGLAKKKTGEAGARLGQYAAAGAAVKLMNSTTHFCSSFPELMCFGRIVLCFWSRFIDIFFGNKQHFYPPKRRDDPHETQHGTWSHSRFCPLVSECIIVSKQCDQSYFTPQKQRQKVYLVSESCLKKGIPKHSTYGISTYAVAYVWC